jgi:hypothetical protein
MEKRKKALEFITRFNDEQMVKLRGKAATALRQETWKQNNQPVVAGGNLARPPGKGTEQEDEGKQETGSHSAYHSVLAYLNFFEEMSLAVCNGLADEEICRRFLGGPLKHLMNTSQEITKERPGMYVYLNELGRRWEAAPPPIAEHSAQ